MKSENEGIELNIIKGIIGINDTSVALYHKRSVCLEHLLYYNSHKTKYNIDKINFISLEFGCRVHCIKKNGKEIRLKGRRYE